MEVIAVLVVVAVGTDAHPQGDAHALTHTKLAHVGVPAESRRAEAVAPDRDSERDRQIDRQTEDVP